MLGLCAASMPPSSPDAVCVRGLLPRVAEHACLTLSLEGEASQSSPAPYINLHQCVPAYSTRRFLPAHSVSARPAALIP